MARYIIVNGTNKVLNIIEYGAVTPPDQDDQGNLIILENPQGSKSVGDSYDPTPDIQERYAAKIDHVVYAELFRLTNAVRVLQGSGALTAPQYRAFLKTLI